MTEPPTPGEMFPQRVMQHRELRHWSKQDLTDALHRIGLPLDRMAVTRTEQGDRKARIDDFLCFAAALDVPPWSLLVPDDRDAPLRVGVTHADAGAVETWLSGDWPLQFPGGDPGHFLWGTGPLGRNTEAQLLRGLVKRAELAETPTERLRVVRAGIQALQGLAVALELDAEEEG